MKLIKRSYYLNKLIKIIGTPDIKVITGVRRSGKSKLLESFKLYIEETYKNANVIHINFNLKEYEFLLDNDELYNHITNSYKENVLNFVLIDEIQMCTNFEKCINYLHALEKFDIYITGSNAFLLSSDLATLFTGRIFEIQVFPFSFKEYLEYFSFSKSIYESFNNYLLEGGMAGSYLYEDIQSKYIYLETVLKTIIIKDINNKYKVRYPLLMEKVFNYLSDNISNISSSRKITNVLSLEQKSLSHKTITSYIDYLKKSFLFYEVYRYDIKGKKYLSTNSKYYLVDHSFRYATLGSKNEDTGRTLENIVAIELLRRGYEIYVGILYKKEIDFVALKRNEKIYIQVSENIQEPTTFNREIEPLLKINDAYPKILITRTYHTLYQYEGVKIFDIADWLLNEM